jgi:hypothetical protein
MRFNMKKLLLALAIIALTPVSTIGAHQNVQAKVSTVNFPSLGNVTIEARYTPILPEGDQPLQSPVLIFRDQRGLELERVTFGLGKDWHSALNFEPVRLPGIKDPLIIAVAVQPGGSDAQFESTVVGVVRGELRDLIDEHPTSNVQGALTIDGPDKDGKWALVSFNFIWDSGIHYQAHPYQCTVYTWTGIGFKIEKRLKTKVAHDTWLGAARELGLSCKKDYVEELLPEYR